MKNLQTKKIYVVIAVILLVVIAIAIAKRLTKNTENPSPELSSGDSSGSSSGTPATKFPLKKGVYDSEEVKHLQRFLNANRNGLTASLTVDGDFGPLTEAVCYNVLGVKEVSQQLYNDNVMWQYLI